MSTTAEPADPPRDGVADTPRTQRKQLTPQWLSDGRDRLLEHRRPLLLLAPGVVYLAIRAVGLLVLSWLSAANGESLVDNLGAWDGEWYLEIAAHGYGGVDPSMVDGYGERHPETPLAFFPGYPLLIQLATLLPGVNVVAGAVGVSLVAGVALAYALYRIGVRVGGGPVVGLLFVALFAASPMSVVLSMAYSEAVFCALAAWALVGVLERNWVLAGVMCAAAGLIRPTAAAVVAVVGLAALIAIVGRRDGWRPWFAALAAPTGLALYIGWVALQTGSLGGYFDLQQQGWSSAFDGGVATGAFVLESLATGTSAFETVTAWVVVASVVLLVLCVRRRMPWPLLAFAAVVLVLDLGSDGLMYSKVRLMLPAFPLLLPVAIGLAQRRTATTVATTMLLVLFGSWFGAYSLTAWEYAI